MYCINSFNNIQCLWSLHGCGIVVNSNIIIDLLFFLIWRKNWKHSILLFSTSRRRERRSASTTSTQIIIISGKYYYCCYSLLPSEVLLFLFKVYIIKWILMVTPLKGKSTFTFTGYTIIQQVVAAQTKSWNTRPSDMALILVVQRYWKRLNWEESDDKNVVVLVLAQKA